LDTLWLPRLYHSLNWERLAQHSELHHNEPRSSQALQALGSFTPNYVPVSPQTAVNILATQPDLNEIVRAIAYRLVSTVHCQEVAHALETKEHNKTNQVLQERLKQYADKVDHEFFLPGCPNGYELNEGRISTQIPIGEGYFIDAKYIWLRDNGRALLLAGKEHHEDTYTIDLYLSPDYSSSDVTEPIPIWFNTLLNSPTPAYHTLHRAIADLNDWNATAEIEWYRRTDELTVIQAEVHLIEDNLASCRYCIEAMRIPSRIPNLEGQAWSKDYPARRCTLGRGVCRGPGGPN
jgi:hypothetical protein